MYLCASRPKHTAMSGCRCRGSLNEKRRYTKGTTGEDKRHKFFVLLVFSCCAFLWLVSVSHFRFLHQSPQHRLSKPGLFGKDGRSPPAAEGYNPLDRLLPAWASREFGGTDCSCVRREGRGLPGRSYSSRSDGT